MPDTRTTKSKDTQQVFPERCRDGISSLNRLSHSFRTTGPRAMATSSFRTLQLYLERYPPDVLCSLTSCATPPSGSIPKSGEHWYAAPADIVRDHVHRSSLHSRSSVLSGYPAWSAVTHICCALVGSGSISLALFSRLCSSPPSLVWNHVSRMILMRIALVHLSLLLGQDEGSAGLQMQHTFWLVRETPRCEHFSHRSSW